ncbi:DUF6114 domain-containing protein [Streptomyces chromofuscus]|uniref:Integral membrane protein n=1 Tax=Streptomyces chromofuscus TaxID=42881 RepID=A0A7M2T3B7_STRCW|nr:DUF6114 domain-containing protein [Streptomyces chromofuscus]QOV43136.1 hypothetical protein IPT68_25705 [Streptomyces chromofuscus]GGT36254.1 hypothetical protein GCM10010254_65710 [Streptomyces chromofuscus]
MSAETPVQSAGTFTRLRLRFRDWRGTRPFWAGLFTLLGGVPIAYFPYATLKLGTMSIAMATTAGAGSLIIGVLLITLGLTMWFQQATRFFAGVAAILLALVSLVVSNIGGFLVGFLLAMVGGALALSWAPGTAEPADAGQRDADQGPSGDGSDETGPGTTPEAPEDNAVEPDESHSPQGPVDGSRAEEPKGAHHVG